MTVLPIAERELRVAARAARTYWSRALAALIVMLIGLVIFSGYQQIGQTKVGGQQLFAAFAYLALAYSLFAGSALTADCLSSEKRDETLGLLFLTDLKGYDVVLGKLVATSLRSVYGLLGTFPILSLPLLLGGVQGWEFWRVILVVLNTVLISLSTGLLISTLGQRQRVTTHLAAGLMLLLATVPLAISFLEQSLGATTPLLLDPIVFSPVYALRTAFDSAYRFSALTGWSFWTAVLVQFAFGICLLVRACSLLPVCWQQNPSTSASASAERPLLTQDHDLLEERRRMLDQNPFYWLAGRGSGIRTGMLLMIALVGAWGVFSYSDREGFAKVQGAGMILVALVTRLLIAVAAAQRFAEDKQSGALDLIITTPLTVTELLDGQWRAIRRKLGLPIIASLGLATFLIFGGQPGSIMNDQNGGARSFTALCFLILTVADVTAVGWLGMWAGLQVRQVPHGAALCLGKVVLPPAIIVGCLVLAHGLTSADEFIKTNPFWVPAVWLGLGLANDLAWISWARKKLLRDFRVAATERYQRPISRHSRAGEHSL